MSHASPGHRDQDQRFLWSHFQNRQPQVFHAARARLDFLVRQIDKRHRGSPVSVLNIGIGDGYFERAARSKGWNVHSLDPDAESCRRLLSSDILACAGSVDAIPLAERSLDAVVASEVLEHLSSRQRESGLSEIARVLRPGGWFLGTVPYKEDLSLGRTVCPCCGESFHRWGHQHSFDKQDVQAALAPWFDVETIRRTAFVTWRSGTWRSLFKSLIRLALAKCGEPIAVPTLYWRARRKAQ